MKLMWRVFATAIGIIAVVLALVAYHQAHGSPPEFNVKPLPKSARILATAEVEQILGEKFHVYRDVRQVPGVVKEAFSILVDAPFEMVGPGEDMSTDMHFPGVPDKRLVLLALADDKAVLVYEQGAFSNYLCVTVFWYAESGGLWGATLEDYSVHDIPSLRTAIHERHFRTWEVQRQRSK